MIALAAGTQRRVHPLYARRLGWDIFGAGAQPPAQPNAPAQPISPIDWNKAFMPTPTGATAGILVGGPLTEGQRADVRKQSNEAFVYLVKKYNQGSVPAGLARIAAGVGLTSADVAGAVGQDQWLEIRRDYEANFVTRFKGMIDDAIKEARRTGTASSPNVAKAISRLQGGADAYYYGRYDVLGWFGKFFDAAGGEVFDSHGGLKSGATSAPADVGFVAGAAHDDGLMEAINIWTSMERANAAGKGDTPESLIYKERSEGKPGDLFPDFDWMGPVKKWVFWAGVMGVTALVLMSLPSRN